MKHLFVPYELAKLAKEKGFNENCLAEYYYGKSQGVDNYFTPRFQYSAYLDCEPEKIGYCRNGYADHTAAPLYQQLVDWFREHESITITMLFEPIKHGRGGYYYPRFRIYETEVSYKASHQKDTYYEALTAALTKAFELI